MNSSPRSLLKLLSLALFVFGLGSEMRAQQPVWGFADLHTHPASHLAFGADQNGNNGIFWGKPGLDLSTATANVNGDLPPCLTTRPVLFPDPLLGLLWPPSLPVPITSFHGAPIDFVQLEEQRLLISNLDSQTPQPHHQDGSPGFGDWPSSLLVEHQQMHITAIKRAYDGGLRLMFADATDNQLLSTLWSKVGFNYWPNVPNPDPNFDYHSAEKQLAFIQSLVAANGSWMQIVKSPVEARQAINHNKLAVVLGLEMDSLNLDQVLSLVARFDVRHVIPIHLANGPFGGSAVYNDAWNSNSWFLNNHQFVQVDFDPTIRFRLGVPNDLVAIPPGFVEPCPISGGNLPCPTRDNAQYDALGYDQGTGGHKNKMGLSDNQAFLDLMRAGLLIDVAHMSEKATEMALIQAETYGYPLMDSHTGIRNPNKPWTENERSLLPSQATRIGNLGGVVGLGPAWDEHSTDPVSDFSTSYQNALQLLGGSGVAIGTDANGLQPLLSFTKLPLQDYRANVATKYATSEFGPPGGVAIPNLGQYQLGGLGGHTYDIHADGLANYGMLPDFLEALHENEQSPSKLSRSVTALYHSAEDVIAMWEKVVAASSNAVPPRLICRQPEYGQCVSTAQDSFTACVQDPSDYQTGHRAVCSNILLAALSSCHDQFCSIPQPTQLTLKEHVSPSVDTGRFDLLIDGNIKLANVGGQADTGFITVSAGTHLVGEQSAGNTNLANYLVQFEGDCASNDTSHGPFTRAINVGAGQQKTCTIANQGFPAVTFAFAAPVADLGKFNIQLDQTNVTTSDEATTSDTANGATVRVSTLASSNHTISVVPADTTNSTNFVVVFARDCIRGVISLSAGDEKFCFIQVLPPGKGGCGPGDMSCGQAPGHPPLCVRQDASCDALCPPIDGKLGMFCGVARNGQPRCVYPPAACN